jgi:hypothetical protein
VPSAAPSLFSSIVIVFTALAAIGQIAHNGRAPFAAELRAQAILRVWRTGEPMIRPVRRALTSKG